MVLVLEVGKKSGIRLKSEDSVPCTSRKTQANLVSQPSDMVFVSIVPKKVGLR